ncbi:LysR family transcriptional regulator [Marinobacterium arenosum]|uniref:LysR family transcriptional regulator n=1 Tax=Marinobacterium arenosum TaxID=2862496 RepID=UPI001C952F97|nr:LysR family transcriptional regulator [Marinobacterium arenosum]MBY4677840.1 LysR family transcriptional regulator [Marinobacterium arenosum]
MRDLPIPLLRTFVLVADTLNLSAAAARLHRAPSTVSMQLNRLEALIGSPLLERGQYGVRLTPTGEALKTSAHQLLNLHDRILGAFQNGDIGGQVRFGTHDQYATRTLVPLLEAFVLSYPEACLEVVSDHRPQHLIQQLEDGKLDLALVELPLNAEGGVHLFGDELVWVRAEAHSVIQRDPLPLAMFADGCVHRAAAIGALNKINRGYRIAFTSQSRAGVLAAVKAGIGVGVIPRSTLEPGLVIENQLPRLPKTHTTLFVAEEVNEASARLAQTIQASSQLKAGSDEAPMDVGFTPGR